MLEIQRRQNEVNIDKMRTTHKEEITTAMLKLQARYPAVQALSDAGCSVKGQLETLMREWPERCPFHSRFEYVTFTTQENRKLRAKLAEAEQEINGLYGKVHELQHLSSYNLRRQASQSIMGQAEQSFDNTAGPRRDYAQAQHTYTFGR